MCMMNYRKKGNGLLARRSLQTPVTNRVAASQGEKVSPLTADDRAHSGDFSHRAQL
jgi:hypothetical protein